MSVLEREKIYHVKISLTGDEIIALWGIIDGAADAGSCPDGFTETDHSACDKATSKLIAYMQKVKRDRGED